MQDIGGATGDFKFLDQQELSSREFVYRITSFGHCRKMLCAIVELFATVAAAPSIIYYYYFYYYHYY